MPSTRSDRKRVVRDEDDLPTNESASPNSATPHAMTRRGTKSKAVNLSGSPKTRSSTHQTPSQPNASSSSSSTTTTAGAATGSTNTGNASESTATSADASVPAQQTAPPRANTNPFHITPDQLMKQYQMLTDQQKSILATYSPADQKKLLEQQIAKRIYEQMSPADQALARARAQQAHQQNQARNQLNGGGAGPGDGSNGILGPTRIFDFSETAESLLKKFENDPPSLVLHIHPSHFRFGNQETVIPKNSPLMKMFLEYVAYKEIPPAATEVFGDSEIRFYEGNIILQIVDHRAVPQENSNDEKNKDNSDEKCDSIKDENSETDNEKDTKSESLANGNADKKSEDKPEDKSENQSEKKPENNDSIKSEPNIDEPKDGESKSNTTTPDSKKVAENTQNAEPKTIRTILRPTALSMWHDLMYASDFQPNPISNDVLLGVESEILRFTIRNLDLRVPKNPFHSPMASIIASNTKERERKRKEQGRRTWSEFENEQKQLLEIHKRVKKEEEKELEEAFIKKENLPLDRTPFIPDTKPITKIPSKSGEPENVTLEEEKLVIKLSAYKEQSSAFVATGQSVRKSIQKSAQFDSTKAAVESLYKYHPEVTTSKGTLKPRKLHEENMQHGSEYEELMLIMSEKPSKQGSANNNVAGQMVRLSFIEQIYKRNRNNQRISQLQHAQQAQVQAQVQAQQVQALAQAQGVNEQAVAAAAAAAAAAAGVPGMSIPIQNPAVIQAAAAVVQQQVQQQHQQVQAQQVQQQAQQQALPVTVPGVPQTPTNNVIMSTSVIRNNSISAAAAAINTGTTTTPVAATPAPTTTAIATPGTIGTPATVGAGVSRPRTQQEMLRQQQLQLQYQQIQAHYPQLAHGQIMELLRQRQLELQRRQMEAIAHAQQQQNQQNLQNLQQQQQNQQNWVNMQNQVQSNNAQLRMNLPMGTPSQTHATVNMNNTNTANGLIANSQNSPELVRQQIATLSAQQQQSKNNDSAGISVSPVPTHLYPTAAVNHHANGSIPATPVLSMNSPLNTHSNQLHQQHANVSGKSVPMRAQNNAATAGNIVSNPQMNSNNNNGNGMMINLSNLNVTASPSLNTPNGSTMNFQNGSGNGGMSGLMFGNVNMANVSNMNGNVNMGNMSNLANMSNTTNMSNINMSNMNMVNMVINNNMGIVNLGVSMNGNMAMNNFGTTNVNGTANMNNFSNINNMNNLGGMTGMNGMSFGNGMVNMGNTNNNNMANMNNMGNLNNMNNFSQ